jgi:hypothetical protein
MDSDNEMIQQIIEDKQEFDADRQEHMSIIGCHQNMLDDSQAEEVGVASWRFKA